MDMVRNIVLKVIAIHLQEITSVFPIFTETVMEFSYMFFKGGLWASIVFPDAVTSYSFSKIVGVNVMKTGWNLKCLIIFLVLWILIDVCTKLIGDFFS